LTLRRRAGFCKFKMLVFLYLLAAMGVAYWAKLDGRRPGVWFVASVIMTPLGASIALMVMDRYFSR
jgi:hypothetical protein